jgi:hypothetical protein
MKQATRALVRRRSSCFRSMLTRIAILMCIASVCMAGDRKQAEREFMREWRREEQRHKKLAAQLTPAEWRAGMVWRFVTTPPRGKPKPADIIVRVTEERAQSCAADVNWKNDWRRLVRFEGKAPLPPIYQVEGRALQIGVAGEICDAYDDIDGVLTGGEFEGRRTTSGLGAPTEFVGTVHGSLVHQ